MNVTNQPAATVDSPFQNAPMAARLHGLLSVMCKKHRVKGDICWLCEKLQHANRFLNCDPHNNAMETALGLVELEQVLCKMHDYIDDQIGMAIRGQRDRYGAEEAVLSGRESAFKDMKAAIENLMRPEF